MIPPISTDRLTITPTGKVVRSVIHGQPIHFFIANPRDAIQRVHATGQFYEAEELEIIRRWCPPGSTFCDIGANVGNHAIFVLKFLHAARVILFEPNPVATAILLANLGLNGLLPRCETNHLGIGLSDHTAEGKAMATKRFNLGAGRIIDGDDATAGGIALRRGDDLMAEETPNFIKIDVEGMEMAVLAGLSDLIARCRPVIFIEIDNTNRAAFDQWVAQNHYASKATFRRYRTNENFLLVPRRIRSAKQEPDLIPTEQG